MSGDKTRRLVVGALRERGRMTTLELAEETGFQRSTIVKALADLRETGTVNRVANVTNPNKWLYELSRSNGQEVLTDV